MKKTLFILSIFCISLTALGQTKSKAVLKNEVDTVSYAMALNLARYFQQMGFEGLNFELLKETVVEQLKGIKPVLDPSTSESYVKAYEGKIKKQKGEKNLAEGKKFLEENKKRSGVNVTASGLQYEILKAGDGPKPTATDKVKTHYHGTLINGTVFDSSVDRGQPITFPLNGVIAGWTEALQLMPVGSKWKLFVPSQLAYRENSPSPAIGPNSTLIFEVELLGIEK